MATLGQTPAPNNRADYDIIDGDSHVLEPPGLWEMSEVSWSSST